MFLTEVSFLEKNMFSFDQAPYGRNMPNTFDGIIRQAASLTRMEHEVTKSGEFTVAEVAAKQHDLDKLAQVVVRDEQQLSELANELEQCRIKEKAMQEFSAFLGRPGAENFDSGEFSADFCHRAKFQVALCTYIN